MDNKVRKNSIYSLLKAFSQVVFPLITFPYISRVLHAENVGKVNFGNSIISYVSLAASLGITTYAVRECSKIKDDKNKLENMVGQIISLNMVTTFIAYMSGTGTVSCKTIGKLSGNDHYSKHNCIVYNIGCGLAEYSYGGF